MHPTTAHRAGRPAAAASPAPVPATASASGPARTRRLPGFALITAAIALVGLLVTLYPSTAAWVSQYQQSQLIVNYDGEVRTLGPEGQSEAIEAARSYNATLTGGAQVAAGERIPSADSVAAGGAEAQATSYEQLLRVDRTGLMARLKIPAIDVDLPVYHGTSDATLLQGVGHLQGTALPVGGIDTHSVLTAHRGLARAELFTHLDRVQVGDTFTIEVFGQVLSYRVVQTRVVEPDQTESLFPQLGRDLVTLVTCTPLGVNSHRILVTGERITPTPEHDIETAGQAPEVPGFPWWMVGLSIGLTVIGGYLVWTRRLGRPATMLAVPLASPHTDLDARDGPPLTRLSGEQVGRDGMAGDDATP